MINLATSGSVFSGKKIRKFPESKFRYRGKTIQVRKLSEETVSSKLKNGEFNFNCTKWAVVTTIFEPPSEAVRRFLYRKEWCVVVVGDKEKPTKVRHKHFYRKYLSSPTFHKKFDCRST